MKTFILKLNNLLHLAQFNQHAWLVIIATSLGTTLTDASFSSWKYLMLLTANILNAGYTFITYNIQEAPKDVVVNQLKRNNPVADGFISEHEAKIIRFGSGSLAIFLYLLIFLTRNSKLEPLLIGVSSMIIGNFYVNKKIKLSNFFVIDLLSYGLLMGVFPFFIAYFSLENPLKEKILFPLLFIVSFSIYKKMSKDYHLLRESNLHFELNSIWLMSEKTRQFWFISVLTLGSIFGILTFLFNSILPISIFISAIILTCILILFPHFLHRLTLNPNLTGIRIHYFLEISLAITLLLHIIIKSL